MRVFTYMCMCMQRPEDNDMVTPPPSLLETGSLLTLKLTYLAGQLVLGRPRLCLPSTDPTRQLPHLSSLYEGVRDPNSCPHAPVARALFTGPSLQPFGEILNAAQTSVLSGLY